VDFKKNAQKGEKSLLNKQKNDFFPGKN